MVSQLLVAWLACPLLLLALSTGIGLGVRALAREQLPGGVVPIAGLAVAVGVGAVLAQLAAGLIVPALVVLSVAGALAGARRLSFPPFWAVAVGGVVFVLYAAPIVLSGEATFAGYVKLDDTATWLAFTDRIMDGEAGAAGLAPSSYEATLAVNLANGYPVGALVPLAFASEALATDPAWLFQPYLALLGAMLALCLWEIARRAVPAQPLRALVAIAAALPALLVGFYLWGGLKEMFVAAVVAGLAAQAAWFETSGRDPRALLLVAVLVLGLVAAASVGAAVWALPALGFVILRSWRDWDQRPRRPLAVGALLFALAAAGIVASGTDLSPLRGSFRNQQDLGNLAGPLDASQIAGIWPAFDFRFDPASDWLVPGLIALVLVAGLAGIGIALLRRDTALWLYPLGTVAVCAAVAAIASPWLDAKALAIASPAVLLAALASLAMAATRWRWAALAGTALLAAGVAWSAVTQWGGASLAPRAQLEELERIGELIAGEGPALMTEYQPYGVRHFLRDADPEGVSELRRRAVLLRDGGEPRKEEWVDTDDLDPGMFAVYRTLVLRRSPAQSRPPAPYERRWGGTYYEVWQRPPSSSAGAAIHLPLGDGADPSASPACGRVRALARRAGPSRVLLAAPARRTEVVRLKRRDYPGEWRRRGAPGTPVPRSAGSIRRVVEVARPGRYAVWLRGSVRPRVELWLDGRRAGVARHRLNHAGQYVLLGAAARLTSGEHEIEVRFGGPDLRPGSGGVPSPIGPLALTSDASPERLVRVAPDDAKRLCGRRWDWIALARG